MIRAARSDDLPALLELWLVSTTQAHPFIDESYWLESLGLVREVYLPGAQTWVWEENGLKGFISVMDARFIGALFVAPDALSQGIGKALLTELIKICTSLGYRQIIAGVGDSANSGSIGVHRSVGFEIAGTMRNVGFKHGRWLDQVLMQRALGDGAQTRPE